MQVRVAESDLVGNGSVAADAGRYAAAVPLPFHQADHHVPVVVVPDLALIQFGQDQRQIGRCRAHVQIMQCRVLRAERVRLLRYFVVAGAVIAHQPCLGTFVVGINDHRGQALLQRHAVERRIPCHLA